MAARGRELRITYGTAVVSGTVGSSSVKLKGLHRIRITPSAFEVSFSALLVSPTKAAFETDTATLEAALSVPRKDLKVEILNPATQAVLYTLLAFSHTGNTGLNITPEWTKPGSRGDTIVSRLYEVTVSGGLPANHNSQAGLRESFEYDVRLSASRRGTLVVRGAYTAVAGVQATAQYQAQIDARVATITSALTGTWALAAEDYTPDDTDQVVRFSRTYKELIFNESAGLLNHPGVTDQTLTIDRLKTTTDNSPGANAAGMVTLVAGFTAAVSKDVTSGLTDLDSLWTSTLRPWIMTNVRSSVAARGFAVVRDGYTVDPVENMIRASVTVQAIVKQTISRLVTTDDEVDYGKIIRKVWPENAQDDLQPTPAFLFRGPKTIVRTITTATRIHGTAAALLDQVAGGGGGAGQIPVGVVGVRPNAFGLAGAFEGLIGSTRNLQIQIGTPGGGDGFGIFGVQGGGGGGASLEKLRTRQTTSVNKIGLPGEQQTVTDTVLVETFELITAVPAGGGGAGRRLPPSKTRTR